MGLYLTEQSTFFSKTLWEDGWSIQVPRQGQICDVRKRQCKPGFLALQLKSIHFVSDALQQLSNEGRRPLSEASVTTSLYQLSLKGCSEQRQEQSHGTFSSGSLVPDCKFSDAEPWWINCWNLPFHTKPLTLSCDHCWHHTVGSHQEL